MCSQHLPKLSRLFYILPACQTGRVKISLTNGLLAAKNQDNVDKTTVPDEIMVSLGMISGYEWRWWQNCLWQRYARRSWRI